VRAEWDGVQWNTKDFNVVGDKFALAEPVLLPLDAKTSLLVGISSKGAAAYRVDFSDMTATVTALGTWDYTHATGVQTTSGPWVIFSKAGKVEFFRYDGKNLYSKWSKDVSAPVATAAWPGTLYLMFAGSRQVYEADPDKGILLPVWSALPEDKNIKKYSLTSSPYHMILGVGDYLWLSAWQWSANEWLAWPVWEEVLP
jgi:hypothetical protein